MDCGREEPGSAIGTPGTCTDGTITVWLTGKGPAVCTVGLT